MVEKKKVFILLGILLILIVSIIIFICIFSEKEGFSVNTILLRSDLSFGEEVTNTITIINNKKEVQNFEVSLKNPSDIILLEEEEFSINPKEEKRLLIFFNNSLNKSQVSPNSLIIETPLLRKEIPLVLVSEDPNNLFSIIHSSIPKYDNVYPGGKLGLNIKPVVILGTSPPTVTAQHTLLNFNNEIIFSDETDLIVGESQPKLIDIPEDLPLGDYIFVTFIEYEGVESIDAYLFSITEKRDVLSKNLKFFVGATLIFIAVLVGLFFYFLKTRDELLMRLKEQQSRELKKNIGLVKVSEGRISRLKKTPEKKKKIKQVKRVKKRIIKSIRKKQKAQRKEFKRLKKEKKKDKIKENLNSWKREGYRMLDTKKEIKNLSKKVVGRKVKDFKEKGYATGFLKK